jgi:uncharacterized protein YkwD
VEGDGPHPRLVQQLASRILIDREVTMARSKFRRAPQIENLESRQVLSSAGAPTAAAQDMLYWINLARTNPGAAAQRIASDITPDIQATLQHYNIDLGATQQAIASSAPLPPVAWNDQLGQAAQGHSQDMVANQYQSHTGSDGSTSGQRMQQAGFANANSTGENAYAYATSVDEAMEAFLIDWGVPGNGHRDNLLQPGVSAGNAYRDVGIGVAQTSGGSSVGPMVITQDFGAKPNESAQLVGVAFNDTNGDHFFNSTEGVANVQIDAVNLKTGQVSSTQTGSSGGYQMPLAPGPYRIIASINNQVIKTVDLNVGGNNTEQDFITSDAGPGGSLDAAVAAAQPAVNAPVASPPIVIAPQPQPQPQPVQNPQSSPAAMGAITWSWTSWKADVSS